MTSPTPRKHLPSSARQRTRPDLSGVLPGLGGSTTLPNRLYYNIEQAIISGALTPGQRLHPDDLAEHFGVSRIPLREALSSLDQAGWVEIVPRHGVHVRARTPTELGELFEVRADVERLVAQWAAQRRVAEDLAVLADAVSASHTLRGADDARLLDVSTAFRDGLRRAAHNSVLAVTSANLEKRARFYFSTVAHQLGDEWMKVDQQVLEYVRAGDAVAAGQVTAEHITDTGEAVRTLLFG